LDKKKLIFFIALDVGLNMGIDFYHFQDKFYKYRDKLRKYDFLSW